MILMTAFGSEETAVEALQKGAASYVPKRVLAKELVPTVEKVIGVANASRQQDRLEECLEHTESSFAFENDPSLIQPVIGYLQQKIGRLHVCDQTALTQIGVALDEALSNAMFHGNLEVSSKLRENGQKDYFKQIKERRSRQPWSDRRVRATVRVSQMEATCTISDEGDGFDFKNLPDPTDPANLEKCSGRGLLLIRAFMNEVRHNEKGNEITMIVRQGGSTVRSGSLDKPAAPVK